MSAVIGILIAIGILIECRYRDIKREIKKIQGNDKRRTN